MHINAGDSEKIGNGFFVHFRELGGLQSTHDILDVGSGYGRMAVPLTTFLQRQSKYQGIEIIAKGVQWCSKEITSRYSNFKFQQIDVKNDRYNPKGSQAASQFKFPFESASFDFVILTSVFTHMLPADLENYLSEISRVLKQGGTCFITYFLLNDSANELVKNGQSQFSLKHTYENCKIETVEDPEYVIAYPETDIHKMYQKHNLDIQSTHYGNWCGRIDFTDFQDIIIGKKK
jgi:SAM-dependent methyltransferase